MFHYTVESPKTPEEAIESLTSSLKEENFGVLWHLNLQEKLNEKGVQFRQPYHILEVCNPAEAERVLSEEPLAGYFLPCKITVYEQNGRTRIGMPKPTALIGFMANDTLSAIATDIEKRLIGCIDKNR